MINQWEIYILNVLWLNGHSRLTWFCHSCCCRGALCFWGQKWTDTVCFAQTSPGYNHRDLLLRLLLIPWLGHFTSCHSHRTHVFRDIPTPRVEGDRPSKMYLVTHYSILHYSILHRIRISSSQIWKKLVETDKETLSEPATARMFLPPPPSTFIKMLECVNLFNWLFKIKLSKLNH